MECFFCKAESDENLHDLFYDVQCPNCGRYQIAHKLKLLDKHNPDDYIDQNSKQIIAALLREKSSIGVAVDPITIDNILNLLNDPLIPKTIGQKLDKILLYYYKKSKFFGSKFIINYITDFAIGYALNLLEFEALIEVIKIQGLFDLKTRMGNQGDSFIITYNGAMKAEQLLTANVNSNKVFVAMGFKDDLIEAHKMAIIPACKDCHFKAFLISEKEHNDGITDKIIAEIKTSKFVITDFTYNNQGAYFEAGYAQGRGIPVIRTCKKEWFNEKDANGKKKNQLHFDISHYNFILWENHDDLRGKLVNRIKATII